MLNSTKATNIWCDNCTRLLSNSNIKPKEYCNDCYKLRHTGHFNDLMSTSANSRAAKILRNAESTPTERARAASFLAPRRKLNEKKVCEIKILIAKDMMDTRIAALFKVSASTISSIRRGKTWAWVVL